MQDTVPLRPGDPERLGAYRLLGRLGDGGQGVVYLGENASGERYAVKWLRAELAGDAATRERFLREVSAARRVAAFCTAQFVETGVERDRPYIVSEYIPGPSLQELVTGSGPRTGPVLHRLAVGTAAALAAIHQAGIVHRDFKPANVLMGPDGPQVIDFGIAKALDTASTLTTRTVGTPSYMAPEQFSGENVGVPADMFAWGCTMVFAATGEAPFGSDSIPAIVHRILHTAPDLDRLDGVLRDVVAACLDKDPARRPTAEQVLLRLLHQDVPGPSVLREATAVARQPAAEPVTFLPPPPAAPPTVAHPQPRTVPTGPHERQPGRSRRGLTIVGSVTTLVVALVMAGIVIAMNGQGRTVAADGTPTPAASTPTPAASTASPTTDPAVPTEGVAETRLPGAQATAYEHPDDKISLAFYFVERGEKWILYPRTSRTGPFKRTEKYWQIWISPDRVLEAGRPKWYTSKGLAVELLDRRTGRIRSVNTVKYPLNYQYGEWTRDGRRLLLTMLNSKQKGWKSVGFIIVDVAAGKAKNVPISDSSIKDGRFYWTDDETQVVTSFVDGPERGLRFYDLNGRVTREITGIGEPYGTLNGLFSPSGGSFVTECPDGKPGDCVWDTTTGERTATVISSCQIVLGWYDETHLYCWANSTDGGSQVNVIDLRGTVVRVLLKQARGEDIGLYYLREPG